MNYLMKVAYFFFALCAVSCHPNEEIPDGKRVKYIRYSESPLGLNPNVKAREEKIIYSSTGNIVKVIEQPPNFSYRTFEYDNLGRVIRRIYSEVTTNNFITSDTISYIGNSIQIDKISNGLSITKYFYDNNGYVIRAESFFNGKNSSSFNFYWKDGNINKKQSFRYLPNELLAYEFFYGYDTKVNFKRNLPMYLDDPINQANNNITSVSFNDYYGDWEALNPTTIDYMYNASSLPYLIKTNSGSRIEIEYQ